SGVAVVEVKSFKKDKIKEVVADFSDIVGSISLPADVEINVGTEDAMGPSIAYVLSSDELSFDQVIEEAPKVAEYLEKASDEIKEVSVAPDTDFEIKIELDAEKLSEKQLDIATIKQVIQANLQVLPGGSIKDQENNTDKQINIENPAGSIDDIKNITLPTGDKLMDVAEIKRESKGKDSLFMAGYLRDGEAQYSDQAVYLLAMKEDEGDVIRMKQDMDKAIEVLYEKDILDEKVEINLTYDSSVYVSMQISSLLKNGFFGLIIILVVFMFFIDIRTGVVVGLIIPFAFLITLFILYQIGYSINILTTFAMILTLGILVDNAIVIAEGMQHRLRKYGDSPAMAAINSIRDLGPAITAATITTVVVFIPFARMGGIMGEIMKYIPYTIIIMLLVSYFLAISITPLLGKWILKKETEEERAKKKLGKWQKYLVIPAIVFYGQRMIDRLVENYGVVMAKIHKRWLFKISILVVLLIGLIGSFSLLGAGKVKTAQFPITDSAQFGISVDFPTGTSIDVRREITSDLMKEAVEVPYFEGSFIMEGQIFILVKDPAERAKDKETTVYTIVEDLNRDVQYVKDKAPEDTHINISAQGHGPSGAAYDIVLEVKDSEEETIVKAINDIDKFVNEKKDNEDYKIKRISNGLQDELVPFVEVNFDKDKMREKGIAPLTTSMVINSVFSQSDVGKITLREDGIQDDVKLTFNDESKNSAQDIKDLVVGSAGRDVVKLNDIAQVEPKDKTQSIKFIDGDRTVSYQIALDIEDEKRAAEAAEFETEIKDYLTKEKLESFGLDEDSVAYGGFASDIDTDFQNLFMIFIIAMVAVYMVLAFQFNSYIQPLLIMMAIPIALIGVFPGIFLVDSSLDMISGLGVIALVGIVVNDAIVFIDYFNRQRKKNPKANLIDTLVYTGKVRFKPIFSTSITTIAAILPLTIGDVFWRGLGTAVIAGLIFATIGNLVVLPIMICMMEKVFAWFRKRRVSSN
ncbi:MAG: efflux RND transporter permease subunit, partial [Parcubacteria group bacterium]|nr:efflux RND transporter permease subunit [Parcubacteria group bacterium]